MEETTEETMEETTEETMEETMEETTEEAEMTEETEAEEPAGPTTWEVVNSEGTSVPGCEEDDTCFMPSMLEISVGDTVMWLNQDAAAHTITSGSPATGPDGVFDSSLVMSGATFEHTFEEPGTYDYFCLVHPWMLGTIQVN
ncbi:MAG: protease inhibitor Kazal-type [Thaumarchaeota archaeon]|nr:protease inhibitor Kazal-type [Nitrososphaerota archaeon]